jgi:hypothetical protein
MGVKSPLQMLCDLFEVLLSPSLSLLVRAFFHCRCRCHALRHGQKLSSAADKLSSAMSESSFPLLRRAPPAAELRSPVGMSSPLAAASNSVAAKLSKPRVELRCPPNRVLHCYGHVELCWPPHRARMELALSRAVPRPKLLLPALSCPRPTAMGAVS